jgi:flagellar protein FlaG
MRLDNIPQGAAPYGAIRPDVVTAPRRAEQAAKVTPAPEIVGIAQSPEDAGRSADHRQLGEAIDSVNEKLARVNRRIDLYLVEGTYQVAAKIVDTESNEVVKFIPPEEVLELRSRIDEMQGLLLNEGA